MLFCSVLHMWLSSKDPDEGQIEELRESYERLARLVKDMDSCFNVSVGCILAVEIPTICFQIYMLLFSTTYQFIFIANTVSPFIVVLALLLAAAKLHDVVSV